MSAPDEHEPEQPRKPRGTRPATDTTPGLLLERVPTLRQPVMVCAFAGWNDAGETATGSVGHLTSTLDSFKVPERERADVLGFVQSLKAEVLD